LQRPTPIGANQRVIVNRSSDGGQSMHLSRRRRPAAGSCGEQETRDVSCPSPFDGRRDRPRRTRNRRGTAVATRPSPTHCRRPRSSVAAPAPPRQSRARCWNCLRIERDQHAAAGLGKAGAQLTARVFATRPDLAIAMMPRGAPRLRRDGSPSPLRLTGDLPPAVRMTPSGRRGGDAHTALILHCDAPRVHLPRHVLAFEKNRHTVFGP